MTKNAMCIEIRNAPVGDENVDGIHNEYDIDKIEIRNAPVGDENYHHW